MLHHRQKSRRGMRMDNQKSHIRKHIHVWQHMVLWSKGLSRTSHYKCVGGLRYDCRMVRARKHPASCCRKLVVAETASDHCIMD